MIDTQNHVWNAEVAERYPEFGRTIARPCCRTSSA